MRINKYIAQTGAASRRGADQLIAQGRVRINGRTAKLGDEVQPEDEVTLDGMSLQQDVEYVYLAYHKPYGVMVTEDPSANNTIVDALQLEQRVFPIGRLDVKTSGLLLLTNDGSIVNKILKAENQIPKEYLVTVDKPITREALDALEEGVDIGDWVTLPAVAEKVNKNTLSLTIVEGKNRQIRRMCEALGYTVTALQRVRIGRLRLDDIASGDYRYLSRKEIKTFIGV